MTESAAGVFAQLGGRVELVPIVFDDDPQVGLQIVGRRLDDAGVLRVAATFEHARPRVHRWPPAAADARS